MAGHKQHDFHLVDPSPWPFLSAVGAFTMFSGAVVWMHGGVPYIFLGGLALILYMMFVWWSDVIKEAHAGDHTPVVQIGLRYGMILFIMSEVMFFLAWFWNYFGHALFPMQSAEFYPAGGVWPPEGVEIVDPWHLPLLNTLILLTSSATVTWAHHSLIEGNRKGLVNGLIVTVVLGAIFTMIQGYEYTEITFPYSGGIYGASFFMATGFHGMHVIIGTLFLLICLLRALRGQFTPTQHVGLEAAAWYWHFVDVVWLFLFAGIYVGSLWGL